MPRGDGASGRLMPTEFAAFTFRDGYPRRLPDKGTYWRLGKEVSSPVSQRAHAFQHADMHKKPRPRPPSAEELAAAGNLHDPRYEALLTTSPLEAGELRAEFGQTVMRFLRSRPVDEVYRRGQAIDMAWAPVRAPEDNLDDPHWEDREFFVEGEAPGFDGTIRYPRAGYKFTRTPVEMRRRAPLLGEHNREVFEGELGLDAADVAAVAGLAAD